MVRFFNSLYSCDIALVGFAIFSITFCNTSCNEFHYIDLIMCRCQRFFLLRDGLLLHTIIWELKYLRHAKENANGQLESFVVP